MLIDHVSENIFVMGVRVSFVLFDALFHSRITDRVSFWVINCELIYDFFLMLLQSESVCEIFVMELILRIIRFCTSTRFEIEAEMN